MNTTILIAPYFPAPMLQHHSLNTTTEFPSSGIPKNSCDNYVDTYPDLASSTLSKIFFGFIYLSTFLFGIVGNASMLYVTLCNQSMITVQNIFIMSLAVSDIMICLISVPITPIFLIYKEWYFGKALCHLIVWVQGSSVFITTYTLMAIALDRYVLINYPHKRPLTIRASLLITGIIWVSAGVVISPYAYFMGVVTYDGVCGEFCDEHWPSENFQEAFTTTVLVFQYVVPFVVISLCYWAVLRRLKNHIREKMDRLSCKRLEKIALSKRKRRSTIVLACMVLVFGTCWLPQNVISMIGNYARSLFTDDTIYFAYLGGHAFAMQSILANPILYAWLNSAFRKVVFSICVRTRNRLSRFFWSDNSLEGVSAGSKKPSTTGNIHPELCTDYLLRRRQSSFPSIRDDDHSARHAPTNEREHDRRQRLSEGGNLLSVYHHSIDTRRYSGHPLSLFNSEETQQPQEKTIANSFVDQEGV